MVADHFSWGSSYNTELYRICGYGTIVSLTRAGDPELSRLVKHAQNWGNCKS